MKTVLRPGRHKASPYSDIRTGRLHARPQASKLPAILGALLFILGGLSFSGLFFVRPFLLTRQARDWQPVKGTVIHSAVRTHDGDDITYSVYIAYRYAVDGQTYESDSYSFDDTSSSGYHAKADIVARHPDGSEIDIFVDPRNPQSSVINRNMTTGLLYIGLFPLFFVAAGLFFLVHTLRQPDPARRPSLSPDPQAFTRTDTRIGGILGTLFVTLFWNSILSVFIFHIYQAWQHGQCPIFGTFFLIPFVIIGLVLIFFIFHAILRCFTPRVNLAPVPTPTYGATARVSYTITGNLARLTKLTVTLVRDITVPDDDNDSYVISHKTILLQTDAPLITETGLISVPIPDKSALLESPDDYDTVWKLTFRGAIPFWPDMLETFTLNIHDPAAP